MHILYTQGDKETTTMMIDLTTSPHDSSEDIGVVEEEEEDLAWLQCTHLLLTNSIPALHELYDIIHTILTNIIQSSTSQQMIDPKFLRLKPSNKTLQKKLFSKAGGEEIIKLCGFDVENTSTTSTTTTGSNAMTDEKIFVHQELLTSQEKDEKEGVFQSFSQILSWLEHLIDDGSK